jgi:hypothetical protein
MDLGSVHRCGILNELLHGHVSSKKKKQGKILGKRKTKPIEDEEEKSPFLRVFKPTCNIRTNTIFW